MQQHRLCVANRDGIPGQHDHDPALGRQHGAGRSGGDGFREQSEEQLHRFGNDGEKRAAPLGGHEECARKLAELRAGSGDSGKQPGGLQPQQEARTQHSRPCHVRRLGQHAALRGGRLRSERRLRLRHGHERHRDGDGAQRRLGFGPLRFEGFGGCCGDHDQSHEGRSVAPQL